MSETRDYDLFLKKELTGETIITLRDDTGVVSKRTATIDPAHTRISFTNSEVRLESSNLDGWHIFDGSGRAVPAQGEHRVRDWIKATRERTWYDQSSLTMSFRI